MPGPGHPGHYPKPPGWIDRPGGSSRPSAGGAAPRPERSGDRPTGSDPQLPGSSGPPRPGGAAPRPAGATPAGQHQPGSEAGGGRGDPSSTTGGPSRAAEAAARVAEMLQDRETEDGEEVEEAAEAVEHDIDALRAVEAQRDEYLDALRRLQADFENYKKRIQRQHADLQERAAEKLVERLLPVLDNFDLALAHAGPDPGLEPIYRSLLGVLESAGLERLAPAGQPFDPNEHDAVLHEPGGDGEAEVLEVMRAGYRWKGRVLRPAMVKVKG